MQPIQSLPLFRRRDNAEAFEELCAPYSGMVYRHCLHMMGNPSDAQDAAQEAMLRAFRAMPRFLGRSSVATWLFKIAHHTCLDLLKKPYRKRESASLTQMGEAGFDPPSREQTPEEAFEREEGKERLRRALQGLPPEEQTLLSLRYGEGYDYAALAEAMGWKEGTVKSRLNRAKARLRGLMDDET